LSFVENRIRGQLSVIDEDFNVVRMNGLHGDSFNVQRLFRRPSAFTAVGVDLTPLRSPDLVKELVISHDFQ
jgi:hypothetical protein